MIPRLVQKAVAGGSKLAGLFPKHVKDWWPFVEDIFTSPRIRELHGSLITEAAAHDEFVAVSTDATMRCCLSILGQAHPRASASDRQQAAFDDAASKRRVSSKEKHCFFVLYFLSIKVSFCSLH